MKSQGDRGLPCLTPRCIAKPGNVSPRKRIRQPRGAPDLRTASWTNPGAIEGKAAEKSLKKASAL
eukprot:11044525-Prorocentrum_lima.AAC.1